MKAITIKEPWASMIATGKKTIEIRSWKTDKIEGEPVILTASKNPDGPLAGKAFGAAVFEIRPMTEADREAACADPNWDITGQYAWAIKEFVPIEKPFPVRGWPGLFKITLP
jgi:hypothetical protein